MKNHDIKLKLGVLAALLIAGVMLFARQAYVVPVLMYHMVGHNDMGAPKLIVNPESFDRQMRFLRDNRYNVVGLDKVAEYLQKKSPVPPRTVAVTFDDGTMDNYTYAYPILKKYGIPATIFVIIKKIGEPGFLGWKEIEEMSGSGLITIGSHTVSHLWLPSMGTADLRRELADSKRVLEERLGKPVDFLCYPIGAHNERVKREARGAGYRCAVATNPGKSSPADDIFAIKRLRISGTSDSLLVFWFETTGYYTLIKEWRDSDSGGY